MRPLLSSSQLSAPDDFWQACTNNGTNGANGSAAAEKSGGNVNGYRNVFGDAEARASFDDVRGWPSNANVRQSRRNGNRNPGHAVPNEEQYTAFVVPPPPIAPPSPTSRSGK